MTLAEAIDAAMNELDRAKAKWPSGFHSGHEGYAVIKEELEELWEAVKRDDAEHATKEAIQICAMALRYLTEVSD